MSELTIDTQPPRLLHPGDPRLLPAGLRPADPQVGRRRPPALLQARRLPALRPRRRRRLRRPVPRPPRRGRMSRSRAVAAAPPRQTPYKRAYADGRVVWIARYLDLDGKRRYAKPRWNGGRSTFARRATPSGRSTRRSLDLRGLRGAAAREGRRLLSSLARAPSPLGAHQQDLRRPDRLCPRRRDRGPPIARVALRRAPPPPCPGVLDHMLRVKGRAAEGARGMLRALSAMAEDAIGDDAATGNAFMGVRLRGSDPRIRKPPRKPRDLELRADARVRRRRSGRGAGRAPSARRTHASRGRYKAEAALLLASRLRGAAADPGLTGLRLGEFLGLAARRFDGSPQLRVLRPRRRAGRLERPEEPRAQRCRCRRAWPG